MAFLKALFGKKKDKDSDGQEEFFREDFAPVVKVPSKKVAEPQKADTAEKVSQPKKAAAKSNSSVKKDEPKKETKAPAKKVENAPAKSSTAKKNTPTKVTSKPAAKPASKSNAKPAAKPTAKSAKSQEIYDDSPVVKGAVAIKESKDTANGKWEIRRAKDGRYFFALYASNHSVIAYSQVYTSTTAVSTGINSVIANAPKCEIEDTTLKKAVSLPCPKWEIYLDKAEQYRFRLYAPNGLIVCHSSHGYATKGGCKGGIESIKRFSADAKIDKSYLK